MKFQKITFITVLAFAISACNPTTEEINSSEGNEAESSASSDERSDSKDAVLQTSCFETSEDFVLPNETFIASDLSGTSSCSFVTQVENQADTTAIAGELFFSSGGKTFEEQVALVEKNLSLGQEPDILVLGLLNTGASGRDLPIIEVQNLDGPNKATIIKHESDRRDGFVGLSAVVEVETKAGEPTQAIIMWGISNQVNDKLIVDLINSMQINSLTIQ